MNKKRIKITDGGIALPLGNNTFLMKGRLHSQGGIGIGNGSKNDIEVEDGEVVKFNKDNIQVLSDQPMLNGISPADALLAGGNFNTIFKAQQNINGNYGGSYAQKGTNKKKEYDFSGIQTTGNRPYKPENIAKAYKYLTDHGVTNNNMIATVLASIIEESGGDPLITASDGSSSKGLLQWTNDRYVLPEGITFDEAFNQQMQFIVDNLDAENSRKNGNNNEWTHGGKGSGYNSYKDANADFINGASLLDMMRGYTLGYVRPAGKHDSVNNRVKVAEQILNILANGYLKLKNGGQVNMTLKNKNKQDIVDIVMNEILPHSTGERKKFDEGGVWSATDWTLLGNTGLNFLSGLAQGIIGSVTSNKLRKMYDGMKRTSTYIPVAREHINTKVDVEPQLSATKLAEQKLINNAQANTSNSKVARQQAIDAITNRIITDNQIYGDKFNKETALRNAEAELQTQYNRVDNQNKLADIREQNEFDMMKAIGKANAKTAEAQTWGMSIANSFKNIGQNLTDYATMKNDLLKSDNPAAYEENFKFEFGHLKNKLSDPEWVAKHKDWIDANIGMITKLGWAKSNMKGSYDKSLTPYIGAFLK